MSDLRKINIDEQEIEVDPRLTLIQACEQAGVEVPRFCYHERLSIAGNCRMCLVEVVGGPPKPAATCAMHRRRVVTTEPAGRTAPCPAPHPYRVALLCGADQVERKVSDHV
jgi:predicted molibdopterin-dependent oxidoreductase YjgC